MNQFSVTGASVLTAALLLAGCAWNQGGGGAGILVDFPIKKPELRCDNNGVCAMKVYARIAPGGGCEVMPAYEDVRVGRHPQTGKGFTPKMRWKIDSIDHGHAYDYRFAFRPGTSPVYGIAIPRNDPRLDFDKPDYDDNGPGTAKDITTFKWENKHLRSLPNDPFEYDLNVERSPRQQDTWSACARVDPKMYND